MKAEIISITDSDVLRYLFVDWGDISQEELNIIAGIVKERLEESNLYLAFWDYLTDVLKDAIYETFEDQIDKRLNEINSQN